MLRLRRVSRRRRETPRAQHPLAGGPRALRAALEPPGAVEDSLDPHRRPILGARHSMERPRGRAFHNLCRCASKTPVATGLRFLVRRAPEPRKILELDATTNVPAAAGEPTL